MIISHTHKYVYIRPMKTASSSVESYLKKHLFNSITDEHNKLKTGLAGPHLNATQIKNGMNNDKWDAYLKMVTERNPWDKVVSLYYWEIKRQNPKIAINLNEIRNNKESAYKNFSVWFDRRVLPLKFEDVTQKNALSHRYYFIGDEFINAHFVKYENLKDDLNEFMKMIGHQLKINEFNKYNEKSGVRPKWAKDYRQFYNDSQIEKIAEMCRETIKLLDYKF